MDRLKDWYNGYSWDGVRRVYNPWSILSFLDQGRFTNFWFQTGTPTFLTKLLRQHRVFQLPGLTSSVPNLLRFDIHRFDPIPILFQTGYLTLAKSPSDFDLVELTYPNREVQHSLDLFLLEEYTDSAQSAGRTSEIREAVRQLDFDTLIEGFNALLSSVPYDHWSGQGEHFFHAIFYLVLRTVGIAAKSEVHTAKGRCDLLIELPQAVVVLEFKLDQAADIATDQIIEHGYLAPYATDPRRKLALGARVGSEEKAIVEWKMVEV